MNLFHRMYRWARRKRVSDAVAYIDSFARSRPDPDSALTAEDIEAAMEVIRQQMGHESG